MLKKLLCLTLIFAAVLSLAACSAKYEPVPSTEEEARVVMRFALDGKKYELKYELYRALFLTYKSQVDGGDESVWEGKDKDKYIDEIDEIIVNEAADIFAVLHLADKLGLKPYSNDYDKKITELIEMSVDGGISPDGSAVDGFMGDYEAYLSSLKENYLNYSVSELLIRYSLAYSDIVSYYKGEDFDDSKGDKLDKSNLDYDDDDVEDFYEGSDSVRVLLATLDTRVFSEETAQQIRDKIAACDTEAEVAECIIKNTATVATDATEGMLLGKYSSNPKIFGELTEAAFALDIGKTSELITVTSDTAEIYYILYKVEKSDDFFKNARADIYTVYEDNLIGKLIADTKSSLAQSVTEEPLADELDRSEISMD